MKQYCRYCAYLVYADVCFCERKQWVKSYNSCKRPNKCTEFELNPIDALCENLNEYKPRDKQIDVNQITLEGQI